MSDTQTGPEWWLASDGRWYPPESHPGVNDAARQGALHGTTGRGSSGGTAGTSGSWASGEGGQSPFDALLSDIVRPASTVTEEERLDGWRADPFGSHEFRYFKNDRPTNLVKDGVTETYERPVDPAPDPVAETPTRQWSDVDVTAIAARARRRRQRRVWVGVIVVLVAGVIAGARALAAVTPAASTACDLLNTAQVRTLLGNPPTVRSVSEDPHPPAGETECTYNPWPVNRRVAFTSVLTTLSSAPPAFPGPVVQRLGTRVTVDGQAAWWVLVGPGPAHAVGGAGPGSAFELLAAKGTHLVGVQVTSEAGAEAIAVRAMGMALPRV